MIENAGEEGLEWLSKQVKNGVSGEILEKIAKNAVDYTKYSDDLIRRIASSNGYADDIIKYVNKYGDDAVKAITKYGDDAVAAINKGTDLQAINKFTDLREAWVDDQKAREFISTLDIYAQKSVDSGACSSKSEFYSMYSERAYNYSSSYINSLKQNYIDTGASSIVNLSDVTNALDKYNTVGRGEAGNFVTSIAEDKSLLFDDYNQLVPTNIIEKIKGVDPGKYDTGVYQYSYDATLVSSINNKNYLNIVNGNTPGSSSLNIPGGYTWAGNNMHYSESELIISSIDVSNYTSVDVLSEISNRGYFQIINPTIICPDGTREVVEGVFKIIKLGD